MQGALAKNLIFLIALSLVVPESYARRLGSGRSVGRQAPISRQGTAGAQLLPARPYAPLPPAAPPLRTPPDFARQSAPVRPLPSAPAPSRPWGGMVGGALLGMGLGSLLSSGDRNTNMPNQNGTNQGNRDTSASSGNPTVIDQTTNTLPAQKPASSGFGSILLWALLGLAAFFLVRRMRARAAQ